MFAYIYKTTNLINGKVYVGQHHGSFDPHYHGSGNLIRAAVKKYGVDNFETILIEECVNDNELNEREVFWISYFDSQDLNKGYNIHKGGISSPLYNKQSHRKGKKLSDETRRRMSEADKGKKKSESHRLHIREARLGTTIPQHTRLKISESVKKNSSSRGTIWIRNPQTKETKKLRLEESIEYLNGGWEKGRYMTKLNTI